MSNKWFAASMVTMMAAAGCLFLVKPLGIVLGVIGFGLLMSAPQRGNHYN